MTDPNYGIVLVTVASQTEGETIAHQLLEAKLAACVNLFPVTSIYVWQEKLEREQEYQLTIKTDLNLFAELSQKIKTLHSYEVPEIIAIPIVMGSNSYLQWLDSSLRLESN